MFEAESATAPGVDLGAITDRMEIRKAVQSGNMEEAIERVNDLNPQVGSRACWCRTGWAAFNAEHKHMLTLPQT